MAETKKQSTKPIEDNNLEGIWDLDTSFDEALGLADKDTDPVLGDIPFDERLKNETEVNEETPDPKEDLPDLDDNKVEELEESKTTEEPVAVEEKTPEFDPNVESKEEQSEESDENEFAIFAKLLAEKDLIDLDEDFTPSEGGLVEAFEKTVEARVQEEIDSFQGTLPHEGKELLNHLMNGGSVSNFQAVYSAPDLGTLDVTGEKASNQKYVLQEYMRLRGDSEEEIRETLEDYEDLGKLEKQATRAKTRLEQYYAQQKSQLAEKTKQEATERETKRQEVITDISDTISNSTEVKGFPLTRKNKKDLLTYMTQTTTKVDGPDGKPMFVTQFQADEMKSSQNIDDFILRAYLRMTDYSLDPVKKKATSDYSSKLKKSLQNKSQSTGTQAKLGGGNKPTIAKSGASWDI
jgi:hypothetical protein|tara:strand:- start:37 stop:1257 length:1221 start_codon:yes stop_codon:yes gene_type:complete